jgi:hypothetical protein
MKPLPKDRFQESIINSYTCIQQYLTFSNEIKLKLNNSQFVILFDILF